MWLLGFTPGSLSNITVFVPVNNGFQDFASKSGLELSGQVLSKSGVLKVRSIIMRCKKKGGNCFEFYGFAVIGRRRSFTDTCALSFSFSLSLSLSLSLIPPPNAQNSAAYHIVKGMWSMGQLKAYAYSSGDVGGAYVLHTETSESTLLKVHHEGSSDVYINNAKILAGPFEEVSASTCMYSRNWGRGCAFFLLSSLALRHEREERKPQDR